MCVYRVTYVILVLCCFIIKAYSINRPYYHFKQLSIKEGLPTSIISLYDDKNGSLWVGTTQGIYRFNGEKIKKYNLPDLLRKNSHYINDIFGDNEERIWAVTSQGISYYEYEKDSLQIFLRHNQPVKASIITTEGSKLLIPCLLYTSVTHSDTYVRRFDRWYVGAKSRMVGIMLIKKI